jgi:hypothetical protein
MFITSINNPCKDTSLHSLAAQEIGLANALTCYSATSNRFASDCRHRRCIGKYRPHNHTAPCGGMVVDIQGPSAYTPFRFKVYRYSWLKACEGL